MKRPGTTTRRPRRKGRYLESLSKRHAVSATQRLVDLQPRVATLLIEGEERIIPIRSVKSSDHVLVKPGDRIPVDGVVVEGRSSVDEAMLSGESAPAAKTAGDRVAAGTINIESALTLRVEGTLKNTALGRIIRLGRRGASLQTAYSMHHRSHCPLVCYSHPGTRHTYLPLLDCRSISKRP